MERFGVDEIGQEEIAEEEKNRREAYLSN